MRAFKCRGLALLGHYPSCGIDVLYDTFRLFAIVDSSCGDFREERHCQYLAVGTCYSLSKEKDAIPIQRGLVLREGGSKGGGRAED